MKNAYMPCSKSAPLLLSVLLCSVPTIGFSQQTREATANNSVLEVVVVTARKREESLQESPIAISALSADALRRQGIQSTRDLERIVPGLTFSEQGSKTPSIFIRGIGQRENAAALDPGVGVYINGIYIPRTDGQLLDTVDTQSIQVLRGPQGTLFGKNNTGGAILVTTKQPHNEAFEGEISTKIGNFGRRDLKISGNFPLNDDTLAMRASIAAVKNDGYLDNIQGGGNFGDEDRIAATTRTFWQVTDTFSADAFLYWSKQSENSAAFTCLFQNANSNLGLFQFPNDEPGGTHSFKEACNLSESVAEDYKVSIGGPSQFKITSKIAALTLAWETDNFDIKSITSWSGQDDIVTQDDQDGTHLDILANGTTSLRGSLERSAQAGFYGGPDAIALGGGGAINDDGLGLVNVPRTPWTLPDDEKREQFSQEIHMIGSAFNDRLSYTVGAFYASEAITDNAFSQLIGLRGYGVYLGQLVPKILGTQSDFDNETYAVFAQGTYDLNDWLQLTLGNRYTVETREREATIYEADCQAAAALSGANPVLCALGGTAVLNAADIDGFLDNAPGYLPIRLAEFNDILNDNYNPAIDVDGDDPSTLDDNQFVPAYNQGGKIKNDETFKKFTPTVTLAANLPETWLNEEWVNSSLVYLTYNKGFKSGGFEMRGLELVKFDGEEVDNYEIGLKLDGWDQKMRFNAAYYYMEYSDIQVRVAEQGRGIADIFLFISNAGQATIQGLEAELLLQPTPNLTIIGSFSWTDAQYDEFVASEFQTTAAGLPQKVDLERSGEDFASTPEISYNLTVMYDWETPIGLVQPLLSMYFRDEIYTGIDGTSWLGNPSVAGSGPAFDDTQPPVASTDRSFRDVATLDEYTLWNFRVGYYPSDNLKVALFVDNLTDEFFYQGGFTVAASAGATMATIGPGRTYGLEANYSF